MSNQGRLIVFEGPDGVGKSTISNWLVNELTNLGIPSLYMAFPGRKEGTLGYHIYNLHHNPIEFGICTGINPVSLQLLHIASHISAIESEILPALQEGTWVILDRFWWSTWVYGFVNGISENKLQKMLSVEHEYWINVRPALTFLVERSASLKEEEPLEKWHKLREAYSNMAMDQAHSYCVEVVKNDETVEVATQQVMQKIVEKFNLLDSFTQLSIQKQ